MGTGKDETSIIEDNFHCNCLTSFPRNGETKKSWIKILHSKSLLEYLYCALYGRNLRNYSFPELKVSS